MDSTLVQLCIRDCQSITESCGVILLSFGKAGGSWERGRGLDRFAQPCEFHFTSLKRSLLCYETSWRALKRIPAHRGLSFMGGRAAGTERERGADIISPILSPPVCLQWPPPTTGCAKEL